MLKQTFSKKIFLGAALVLLGGAAIFTAIQFGTASPGAPSPGHTPSQIGGDTDAERTFAGSGEYTFPSDLDVSGDIKIGNSGDGCTATNEGAIRYNSDIKLMEFCNENNWLSIGDFECSCDGTGYETYIVNGDIIYVDCNADKCWTSTAGSVYAWSTGEEDSYNCQGSSCIGGGSDCPACDYCDTLVYGGFTDYVLPDKSTLFNLCMSFGSGCFDGEGCFGLGCWYWSSTGRDNITSWGEIFRSDCTHLIDAKSHALRVRCVRE